MLKTARLSLRSLSVADVKEIHELRVDPLVAGMTGRVPSTGLWDALLHIEKIRDLMERGECVYWGLSLLDNPELIGTVCFWNFDVAAETIELGYELLPAFQGQGLMAEAVQSALDFGFRVMGAKLITAFPVAGNLASVRLLERLGFVLEDGEFQHGRVELDGMLTFVLRAGV